MAVFFQNIDTITGIRSTTEKSVQSIQTQLASLRAELDKKPVQDIEGRKKIQREMKRLERLDNITEGKGLQEENKKDVFEILKGKNQDTLKNSDILTLRKKGVDIANLTLIDELNPDKEIRSADIKVDDRFVVNFGANKSLRDRTGAGDILPANIKSITINGILCERRNTPRPGYYNDNEKPPYQKIYDGYVIVIKSLGVISDDDEKANERQWKRERLEDTIENSGNALTAISEDLQFEQDAKTEIKSRNKYQSIGFDINDIGPGDMGLLDFIGIAEGTGSNYNAIYGNGSQSVTQFTTMTLSQILDYQKDYKSSHGSAAIGRYQFMDYTLKSMMQKYGIGGNTIFSAETQDRLAFLKLNERGLSSFKSGRLPQEDFQMNLAREWASIAKDPSGLSYYHGDSMNNHASAAGKKVGEVLDKLYQA